MSDPFRDLPDLLFDDEAWLDHKFSDQEAYLDLRLQMNSSRVVAMSVRDLAMRWHWGRNKAHEYLKRLCEQGVIQKRSGGYRVTLVKNIPPEIPKPAPKKRATKKSEPGLSPAFDVLWTLYPKKEARLDAIKAYNQVRRGGLGTEKEILKGLQKFVSHNKKKRQPMQFWPHLASWLRGARWTDDLNVSETGRRDGKWKRESKSLQKKAPTSTGGEDQSPTTEKALSPEEQMIAEL